MTKNNLVGGVAILVLVAVAAFYGGFSYGKTKYAAGNGGANFTRGTGAGAGAQRRLGGRTAGQFVNGDIISKDDKSITIKSVDGGSKIIYYSASTTIGKATVGSFSDLVVGTRVIATGAVSGDGTMSAQTIQIRPEMASGTPFAPGMGRGQ